MLRNLEKELRMNNQKFSKHSKLIVLVPENEIDEVRFAKKVRSLAEYYGLDILFIGNSATYETESTNRRRLITLAGISNNGILKTDYISNFQNSWLKIIKQTYQTGDYLLCMKEINISQGLQKQHQLWKILSSKYGSNVIAIKGFMIPEKTRPLLETFEPLFYWAGIIAIFSLSFYLEANLGNHTFGWIRILGESALVVVEIFSLWIWNSLLNRG
jgi:hypothetical protein